jgi:uncharacterized ferritin-like protein (DUF455 family)
MTKLQYIKWFKAMLKEEKNGVKEYTKLINQLRKDNSTSSIANALQLILKDEKDHVKTLGNILYIVR